MIRIMCDTNIILDVLLKRQPFIETSRKVLDLCENNIIDGIACATTITDIYYYVHKHFHNNDLAYDAIQRLLSILEL